MSLIDEDSSLFGFDSDAWLEQLARARSAEVLGSLGPYELIAEAGRGGQGVVFRARQPGTGREIALKRLLAGAFASPEASRRFEREVEAATTLSHPGIVTVYGVDVVEGAPLLAMEWIDGLQVTRWVQGRPRAEVLRVFLLVCDAVQHAHQRGVLHRDLKPSNVLVDRSGQPRVLDFGLAKLTSGSEGSLTTSGQFLGTPAFAAPEQWRGGELDARADVYSLGAILFQMLTGRAVIEGEGLEAVARASARNEPPRPSSLSRSIPRDLDAIVLQALANEREERYQSVDSLSADVRRFLAGEPVLAHPRGALYVLRKLVARHRLATALVVALIVATFAYAVTVSRHAGRLAEERDRALLAGQAEAVARQEAESEKQRAEKARTSAEAAQSEAERERQRAEVEQANAEAVLEFVARDLIAEADPARLGHQPSFLDLLRAATPKVDARFEASPVVAGRVRAMLASAFQVLGSYDEAESEMRRALAARRDDPAATAAQVANDEAALGTILLQLGEYREAEELLRAAIARHEGTQPLDSEGLTTALDGLGNLLLRTGRAAAALPVATRVLELSTRAEDRLSARHNLALLYQQIGQPEEGVAQLEQILRETSALEGEHRADVAHTLRNLADAYEHAGNLEQAEATFRRALEMTSAIYGPDHPRTAHCMARLANDLALRGQDLEEAEDLARHALDVARSAAEGLELAETLYILGVVLARREDPLQAEPFLTEALFLFDRHTGRPGSGWWQVAVELAEVLQATGELDRAEGVLVEMQQAAPGSEWRSRILHDRASLKRRRGDVDGAAALYEQLIALLSPVPAERANLAAALQEYALVLRDAGDAEGAAELELQASELRK
ncbi:MAG: tetratricopeptide repeat protein [Planctomycetes bacterium]|nr:tetratricopeptide repeat protein [Planctomycetota bacterium]